MKNILNTGCHPEKWREVFIGIGFTISLLMVITAFEWKFYDQGTGIELEDTDYLFTPLEDIVPTVIEPPRPASINPTIIEVINKEPEPGEIIPVIDTQLMPDFKMEIPVYAEKPLDEKVDVPIIFAEENPSPVGGLSSFYTFINKEIKYPSMARNNGIEGVVYVSFIIDLDGSLTDIRVVKGIGGGCDEEALRVLKMAPPWNPGKQRGRPVRVIMQLPVIFQLRK